MRDATSSDHEFPDRIIGVFGSIGFIGFDNELVAQGPRRILGRPHARLRCAAPQLGKPARGYALEYDRARCRLEGYRRFGECRQAPPVM